MFIAYSHSAALTHGSICNIAPPSELLNQSVCIRGMISIDFRIFAVRKTKLRHMCDKLATVLFPRDRAAPTVAVAPPAVPRPWSRTAWSTGFPAAKVRLGLAVAACPTRNSRKDNSTAMKPLRMPREPTSHELLAAKRAFPPNYLHETWRDYLYWDAALEQ